MSLPRTLASRLAALLPTIDRGPLLAGLCGWADTGKSTLARETCRELVAAGVQADCLSTDAFLQDRARRQVLGITGYDPAALDAEGLAAAVRGLAGGVPVAHHPYDNRTGRKAVEPRTIAPVPVVVVEGIHAFHPVVARALHLRVFIDADEDTLRAMRWRGNREKRGMEAHRAGLGIDQEWRDFVRCTRPRKIHADIEVAVDADFGYIVQRDTADDVTAAILPVAHSRP